VHAIARNQRSEAAIAGIVVQWLEHRPVTAEVAGSSPVSPVKSGRF
jgi:hypothetical protein